MNFDFIVDLNSIFSVSLVSSEGIEWDSEMADWEEEEEEEEEREEEEEEEEEKEVEEVEEEEEGEEEVEEEEVEVREIGHGTISWSKTVFVL